MPAHRRIATTSTHLQLHAATAAIAPPQPAAPALDAAITSQMDCWCEAGLLQYLKVETLVSRGAGSPRPAAHP
jgi:hypothetical protein